MASPQIVETRYGSLRGSEVGGIHSFAGVRFARAPRGVLRFQPPVEPEPWTGVREATRPGPAAPQYALPWFGWVSGAGVAPGSDCLSLNVWTPGLDSARRPVMVWIHGGGFMVGSGATPIYDGASLARRGDVVVVTINYRLGALGYTDLRNALGAGFERSTNLGVRDQIAALEWVHEHIDRFGGSPDDVTVFGQSAGAMSVATLLGAPSARWLFQRAICMSGAADHVQSAEEAQRVASTFLDALGGPPATREALGEIPMDRLLRAQRDTTVRLSSFAGKMMVFLPTVDGDVLPEPPLTAVRRGETAHMPLLVGTTLDEWKLFRLVDPGPRRLGEEELVRRFRAALGEGFARPPEAESAVRAFRGALESRGARTSPSEVWSAFQSARVMHHPATRLADAHTEGGGVAHAYLFTWRPPVLRRTVGACHALDIPFVFGSVRHPLLRPLTGLTAATARLSLKMQSAWLSFARSGVPRDERLPDWRSYDPEFRATMLLGRSCNLASAPLEAERSLLEAWAGRTERPTLRAVSTG